METQGDSQRLIGTHSDSKRLKDTNKNVCIPITLTGTKRLTETHKDSQRLTETHRDSRRLTET